MISHVYANTILVFTEYYISELPSKFCVFSPAKLNSNSSILSIFGLGLGLGWVNLSIWRFPQRRISELQHSYAEQLHSDVTVDKSVNA
jgi:hypothetical protein